jgi:hypothetical protein
MDEHDDLQARLRQMGTQPVDPAVRADHLARMAGVRPRSTMRPKLRVAAAFLAGLLVGGSGLAAAGALPDPVQHAAHRTLDPLGIDVPDPERYHGPECGDEVKKNHGAYVRDDNDLAKSRCGKPVKAGTEDGDDGDEGEKAAKGPCQGPPPWAGPDKASMTAEEKAAAQAERVAECGDEAADEPEAEGTDDAERTTDDADVTTTTAAPTTTTTEATTTTEGDGTGTPEAGS